MFDLLKSIGEFFSTIFNTIFTIIKLLFTGIDFLINGITQFFSIITGLTGFLPSIFVTALFAGLSIFIVFKILGRN